MVAAAAHTKGGCNMHQQFGNMAELRTPYFKEKHSNLWPHLSVLPYSASEMVMSYAEIDLAMVPAGRQFCQSIACR